LVEPQNFLWLGSPEPGGKFITLPTGGGSAVVVVVVASVVVVAGRVGRVGLGVVVAGRVGRGVVVVGASVVVVGAFVVVVVGASVVVVVGASVGADVTQPPLTKQSSTSPDFCCNVLVCNR